MADLTQGPVKQADGVSPPSAAMHSALHTPRPVAQAQRFEAMDVVRGLCMLGILAPNILYFSGPGMTGDPVSLMPDTAWNHLSGRFIEIALLTKMQFTFALLFGAGVLMYSRKFDPPATAQRPSLAAGAGLWYSRTGWLALMGLLHGLLLWYGDILWAYALAGLTLVWWVRRLHPAWLLTIAVTIYALGAAIMIGLALLVSGSENTWATDDTVAAEIAAYQGTYLDALGSRAIAWLMFQLYLVPGLPMILGTMIAGLALARLGFLTGERSPRLYIITAALGIVGGGSLTLGINLWLHANRPDSASIIWQAIAQPLGIPLALGYASVLILITKLNILRPLTRALAAVGQMALSNYLAQTLICTTIFYGQGFGLFGFGQFAKLDFPALWLIVIAIWAFNITFSLLWLRAFRFGPMEWLWRSLTYFKPQPILRARMSTNAG